MIDNFARWYIEDPLLYRIRVRTEGNARERLDYIIYSAMREELGRNELSEVVRSTNRFVDRKSEVEQGDTAELATGENPMRAHVEHGRAEVMKVVTARADAMAKDLGIRVLDVRIKRADLLQDNLMAVYKRMRAERSRISTGYRSEGQKQVEIIEGNTDRQTQVLMAEAKRDARVLEGEGDAQAARIYADAFSGQAAFYEFIQSLEVLQTNLPEGSEMVLGTDSGLFRMLKGK